MRLFIVGMPGCGKTTVGRLVAEKIGLNFFDTDYTAAALMGMSPEEAITCFGEKFFRKYETNALKKICKNDGFVCATGGGAVTVDENNRLMKSNGTVFFIERDIAFLDKKGRPLSCNIEFLYNNRIAIYRNISDYTVNGNGSPEETAKEIVKIYEALNNKRSES